jgi:hypothetical protein
MTLTNIIVLLLIGILLDECVRALYRIFTHNPYGDWEDDFFAEEYQPVAMVFPRKLFNDSKVQEAINPTKKHGRPVGSKNKTK